MAGLIEAEKVAAEEREAELRRVKQREYAEQQLRVEAEDRLVGTEREDRDELRRLGERLGAGEHETRELTGRVEELQRQLAEAEQAAASERAALRRAENELRARVAELERRTEEVSTGLRAERSARERTEQELAAIHEGHRRMEGVLGEVKGIVGRLAGAVRSNSRPAPALPRTPPVAAPTVSDKILTEERGTEMADALAAAVERLRARADVLPDGAEGEQLPGVAEPAADAGAGLGRPLARTPEPPERARPEAPQEVPEPPVQASAEPEAQPAPMKPHKHTMTLLGRIRYRRKQRRGL